MVGKIFKRKLYPSRHQYKEYIFLQTARRTTRSGIITKNNIKKKQELQ